MSEAALMQAVGDPRTFVLAVGQTILDAALAQGLAIDHACGGVCACSTCHVKVQEGADCLSAPSEDELDQLDEARGVGLDSRLACQARLLRVPAAGSVRFSIPLWNANAAREAH